MSAVAGGSQDPSLEDVAPERLKEALLTGARWVTLARAAAEVLAFGGSVALARMIGPAEFGQAVVAVAVSALGYVLLEGLSSPIVVRKTMDRAHLESAAALALALGLGAAILVLLAARPLFTPLFGARTADLVQLTAPVFLASGLSAVPKARLQRALDFRTLSIAEIGGLAAGTATSVTLAVAGLEAEALVLGVVATAMCTCLLLLVWTPLTVPRPRRADIRETAGFALPSTLSSLSYVGYQNVDYAILGAKLGAAQVGFYWRAFQLGAEYQSKVSRIMLRVAFPVYSRARSLEEMRRIRGRIVRLHAAVIFPLVLLYLALAPDLVPWLFGERWEPVVLPSQVLCIAGLTSAVGTGTGALVLAAGRPRALLVNNALSLALYAGVVLAAVGGGLIAVCVAIAVLNCVTLVATQYFLGQRIVGIPLRELATDVFPALVSAAPLLVSALAIAALLGSVGAPAITVLIAAVPPSVGAYAFTLRRFFPAQWEDLVTLVQRIRKRGGPSTPVSPAGVAAPA